jgi:hypothetical protein
MPSDVEKANKSTGCCVLPCDEVLSMVNEDTPIPRSPSTAAFCFLAKEYFTPKVLPSVISLVKSKGANLSLTGVITFPTTRSKFERVIGLALKSNCALVI